MCTADHLLNNSHPVEGVILLLQLNIHQFFIKLVRQLIVISIYIMDFTFPADIANGGNNSRGAGDETLSGMGDNLIDT